MMNPQQIPNLKRENTHFLSELYKLASDRFIYPAAQDPTEDPPEEVHSDAV